MSDSLKPRVSKHELNRQRHAGIVVTNAGVGEVVQADGAVERPPPMVKPVSPELHGGGEVRAGRVSGRKLVGAEEQSAFEAEEGDNPAAHASEVPARRSSRSSTHVVGVTIGKKQADGDDAEVPLKRATAPSFAMLSEKHVTDVELGSQAAGIAGLHVRGARRRHGSFAAVHLKAVVPRITAQTVDRSRLGFLRVSAPCNEAKRDCQWTTSRESGQQRSHSSLDAAAWEKLMRCPICEKPKTNSQSGSPKTSYIPP